MFSRQFNILFYVYQPSSSSRAAEALSRESGVIPGFVGFDTTANLDLSYVPAVHGVDEIDNLVDAEFRLVLRKMSKRDVTTRLKVKLNFMILYYQLLVNNKPNPATEQSNLVNIKTITIPR